MFEMTICKSCNQLSAPAFKTSYFTQFRSLILYILSMSFYEKLQPIDAACNFVRKGTTKYLQENFRNFKKNYVVEPMLENLCGGICFNRIAWIDSRPGTLLKRSLHHGCFL